MYPGNLILNPKVNKINSQRPNSMKKQRRNLTRDPLTSSLMRDPRCVNFGYRPNKGTLSQDKMKADEQREGRERPSNRTGGREEGRREREVGW